MSRKIKILMLSSLLLNVLLLGIIIGQVSHRLGKDRFNRKQTPGFVTQLPKDKEKLFFETMEKVRLENKDIYKQIREVREKAIAILTAPEFDEEAYRVEVEKLHALRGLMMQRLNNATKELAKQFDQKERKALVKYLRQSPSPSPETRSKRHAGPPSRPTP